MGQANIISDVFIRAASSAKDDSNGTETNVPGWATLNFAVKMCIRDRYLGESK